MGSNESFILDAPPTTVPVKGTLRTESNYMQHIPAIDESGQVIKGGPLVMNKRLTLLENAKVIDWLLANRETVITKPSAELATIASADLCFDVSKAEINLRRNALNMQRVKPKPDAALLPEQMMCEAIADLAAIVARLCASDEERQRVERIQTRFSGFTY